LFGAGKSSNHYSEGRDVFFCHYAKKIPHLFVFSFAISDPHSTQFHHNDGSLPLFSASELAPTYHDGGIHQCLGCPHYARSCAYDMITLVTIKNQRSHVLSPSSSFPFPTHYSFVHFFDAGKLRHPTSGRLYTCRLCCEQTREMATNDKDSPLDRYEVSLLDNMAKPLKLVNTVVSYSSSSFVYSQVTEVLCMICGALQPASDKCVNPGCHSGGKPFARYSCNICNFYDDSSSKSIYHCPFCNVCRSGQGLGIDYYHCMRCNACVSIKDDHHCIPQRLQGNCPICHETMFESTEPLRGLKCGHVMHLSCFTMVSCYMLYHFTQLWGRSATTVFSRLLST
jgi:hypothetical protein